MGQILTAQQVKWCAMQKGFTDATAEIAAAVAMAESSGKVDAIGDQGSSYGLWQVHLPAHPTYSVDCLTNALCCAEAAYNISSGGTNWQPWTQYRNGAYKAFLPVGEPKPALTGEWGEGVQPEIAGIPLKMPSEEDIKRALIVATVGMVSFLLVVVGLVMLGASSGVGKAVMTATPAGRAVAIAQKVAG